MTPMDSGAVLVGFLAFLGVLLAPIVTSFMNGRQERKKLRHNYILSVVTALIEIRSELQYFQLPGWNLLNEEIRFSDEATTPEFQQMEIAYGKAYAIMISIDIEEIRNRAPEILAGTSPDKKLAPIDFALKRLGEEYGFFKGG